MHKKGITEEVAKKRSRKTVKHQRGIVGADLAAIAAKRNQTTAIRQQQRLVAITKAKTEKKDKESKKEKEKAKVGLRLGSSCDLLSLFPLGTSPDSSIGTQGVKATDEGRFQGFRKEVLSSFYIRILCRPKCSCPLYVHAICGICIHCSFPEFFQVIMVKKSFFFH